MTRRLLLSLLPLLLILLPGVAHAHQSSVTYSKVAVGDDGVIDYTLMVDSRDLYEALALHEDRDASDAEITAGETKLFDYVLARVKLAGGSGACRAEPRGLRIVKQANRFAELRWLARCPTPMTRVTLVYDLFYDLDRGHVGMLQITHRGRTISRDLTKNLNTFEWSLLEPVRFVVRLEPDAVKELRGPGVLEQHLSDRIAVATDAGRPCAVDLQRVSDLTRPRAVVEVGFLARCDQEFTALTFTVGAGVTGTLHILNEPPVDVALDGGEVTQVWRSARQAPASKSLLEFVEQGMHHIFTGYDHICFVIGLLLVAVIRRRRGGSAGTIAGWEAAPPRLAAGYVLSTVTAFTVAHSLTLIAAALGWVELPGKFVEATIAASIVYVAVENVVAYEVRRRWLLAFVFGLIHGLGFASLLRPMLPPEGLVLPLVMFNVGVELGQMAIVLVLFPALAVVAARSAAAYRRIVLCGGSALVGLFGLLWFVERVFGVETISRVLE